MRQPTQISPTANDVLQALFNQATPERAANSSWFFKTNPGQYGHGDKFMGVTVPQQRRLAKQYRALALPEVITLLQSEWHEARLTALFILVQAFQKADVAGQEKIYDIYLQERKHINNWDLVDSSAGYIVGAWLHGKPKGPLYKLADSSRLWDRRIAMIATLYDIKLGEPAIALDIAERLVDDPEDLMQKAVGWMLREVGKRCSREILEDFLTKHYKTMPRTALRYSIEHFPESQRQAYLRGLI